MSNRPQPNQLNNFTHICIYVYLRSQAFLPAAPDSRFHSALGPDGRGAGDAGAECANASCATCHAATMRRLTASAEAAATHLVATAAAAGAATAAAGAWVTMLCRLLQGSAMPQSSVVTLHVCRILPNGETPQFSIVLWGQQWDGVEPSSKFVHRRTVSTVRTVRARKRIALGL